MRAVRSFRDLYPWAELRQVRHLQGPYEDLVESVRRIERTLIAHSRALASLEDWHRRDYSILRDVLARVRDLAHADRRREVHAGGLRRRERDVVRVALEPHVTARLDALLHALSNTLARVCALAPRMPNTLAPVGSLLAPQPRVWQAAVCSTTGRTFYHDALTRDATWTRPRELQGVAAPSPPA